MITRVMFVSAVAMVAVLGVSAPGQTAALLTNGGFETPDIMSGAS